MKYVLPTWYYTNYGDGEDDKFYIIHISCNYIIFTKNQNQLVAKSYFQFVIRSPTCFDEIYWPSSWSHMHRCIVDTDFLLWGKIGNFTFSPFPTSFFASFSFCLFFSFSRKFLSNCRIIFVCSACSPYLMKGTTWELLGECCSHVSYGKVGLS